MATLYNRIGCLCAVFCVLKHSLAQLPRPGDGRSTTLPPKTTDFTPGCGGVMNDSTGQIALPRSVAQAQNTTVRCLWVVPPRPGKTLRVEVTFDRFQLDDDCSVNYFIAGLKDHSFLSPDVVFSRCGRQNDSEVLGEYLRDGVWFEYFANPSAAGRAALNVTYRVTETPIYDCSIVLRNLTGQIAGPAGRECRWLIVAPAGYVVNLTVHSTSLTQEQCDRGNYLQIFNGAIYESFALGTLCSLTSPATFTSDTNGMQLHFRSSGATGNSTVFHAIYNIVPFAAVGCNKKLSGQSGTVESPGYPHNYESNLDCRYNITVQPGYRVALTFTSLVLEGPATRDLPADADNCVYDFIEIGDSDDRAADRVKTCGYRRALSYTSDTNSVSVRFKTDGSVNDVGFTGNYRSVCSNVTLTSPRGVIGSPSGTSGSDCSWRLVTTPGKSLNVTLSNILPRDSSTGCQRDFLEIVDGSSRSARVTKFCPGDIAASYTYLSYSNSLWIYYHAYFIRADPAFRIEYNSIDSAGRTLPSPSATTPTSGGAACGSSQPLTDPTGVIISPGFLRPREGDMMCEWRVRAPTGQRVVLTFNFFVLDTPDITCEYDYLEIRDGDSRLAPSMGKYCGSQERVPKQIVGDNGNLLIRLVSTWTYSAMGFNITYDTTTAIFLSCGGNLRGLTGDVTSPGWSLPPPARRGPGGARTCTWQISVPDDHRIVLTTKYFNVREYDYVEFRSGINRDQAALIGRYSGNAIPPTITADGNHLLIVFYAKITNTLYIAFHFSYNGTEYGCGRVSNEGSGSIASLNYPAQHPVGLNCLWRLTASAGNRIQVFVRDIDLLGSKFIAVDDENTCRADHIMFRDTNATGRLLGKYCGSDLKLVPPSLTSASDTMWVQFRADTSLSGRGFFVDYRTMCESLLLTGSSGAVESPHYPMPYPANSSCSWTLRGPADLVFNISFQALKLEGNGNCTNDYVEFQDAAQLGAPARRFCGPRLPAAFLTTSSTVFLRFVSSAGDHGTGFRLVYNAVASPSTGLPAPPTTTPQPSTATIRPAPTPSTSRSSTTSRATTPRATTHTSTTPRTTPRASTPSTNAAVPAVSSTSSDVAPTAEGLSGGEDDVNVGAVVGGVLGSVFGLVVVVIIVALVLVVVRRRRCTSTDTTIVFRNLQVEIEGAAVASAPSHIR